MCLNTVEQLQASGNNPGRQRGALQALDHILFMTPAAHPSVYDCLCSLVKPAGTREAQVDMDELVDLVFRHSDRFSSNDETSELSTFLNIQTHLPLPFDRYTDPELMLGNTKGRRQPFHDGAPGVCDHHHVS